jgi:hypothetical protein
MRDSGCKLKTSTIIKIYGAGLAINGLLWIPYYCFLATSSKSLLITIPAGTIIFIGSYRYFIYRAKKRGKDLTQPI